MRRVTLLIDYPDDAPFRRATIDAVQHAIDASGRDVVIDVTPPSRLAAIYGSTRAVELATCNYGLEPTLSHIADGGGMITAAVDDTGEVRAIELPDHPFFFGTLYMPQLTSAPGAPHPIWKAFVDAL